MKKVFGLFALSLLILTTACKKTVELNDASTIIPNDASSVTVLNIKNLMQKADFENTKNLDFYKNMIAEAEKNNPAFAEILRNPTKSGISLEKNIYLVNRLDFSPVSFMDMNQETFGSTSIYASISDKAAFEAMLQSMKDAPKIASANGLNYFESSSNAKFVAWNDKNVILSGNFGENNAEEGIENSAKNPDFKSHFNIAADKSLAQNDKFKTVMAQNHDIVSLMNFDKLADNGAARAAAGFMNIDPKALKGNYATSFWDFDNGKMTGHSDYHINTEISKQWSLAFKNAPKTDFSRYINATEVGAAVVFALDMRGVKEIINANPQFNISANMLTSETGIAFDDIVKSFDGDIALVTAAKGKTDETGFLALKIRDKAAFNAMLAKISGKNGLTKESENSYKLGLAESNTKIIISNDIAFVGNATAIEAAMKNTSPLAGNNAKLLNNNILAGYLNVNALMKSEGVEKTEVGNMEFSLNGKSGEMNIHTSDPSKNALKSLIEGINQAYLKNKEKEQNKTNEL